MPTSADDGPELLVDTSVAVALSVADHSGRLASLTAVRGRRIGLAGHAAVETYSVLTRLPAPSRLTPDAAERLIAANFPATRFLGARPAAQVIRQLAASGIAGGAVYDGLVGATALEHGVPLVSRDRRALPCYRSIGVDIIFVD